MVALLDMIRASCGVSCGVCGADSARMFREDFVERGNGGVDMRTLQNVRGKETQHGIAGAIDDDSALEHLGDSELGKVGGIELGGNHQALAAHVDDGAVTGGKRAKLRLKIIADCSGVGQEIFFLDVV